MNKKTKRLLGILSCCVVLIIVLSIVLFTSGKSEAVKEDDVIDNNVNEVIEDKKEYTDSYYRDFYNSQKAINEDYQGTLFFKSGLIVQPFVQGTTNGTYLRTDWTNGKYDVEGSNFMDAECGLDSHNLVIYGHYVFEYLDPTLSHKFTPLEQLLDENNYKDNNIIYLLLEDEIREYEIASVSYVQLIKIGNDYYTEDDFQYYLSDFSEVYFDNYHHKVKLVEQYDTGVDFTYEDKLLTLQTCTRSREDMREIVICVLRNTYKLDGECTFEKYDLSNSERFE